MSIGSASSSQSEDPDRHRTPDFLEATWPSNTDLVTVASSKGTKGVKLLLNSQKPLVHAVVVDAIENMQASLLFTHAFPDGVLQFTFAKECLLTAADKPSTALIYSRLLEDKDYLAKLSQLVSFIIAKTALLMLCNSHALGSLTYGVRSRIAATPSPQQQYWPSRHQRKYLMRLSNKYGIILIHIRSQPKYAIIVCTNTV